MMNEILVIPAYGREYKSKRMIQEDWDAGKDFLMVGMGQRGYINKEDAEKDGVPGNQIKVRFANRTKFTFIKIKKGGTS